MVDHTFVYTGAVRKIRELTRTGDLGDIYYYDSVRINLGSVPARRQRAVGPRGARPVDHGFRAAAAARGRVGHRSRARAGQPGEHRLHDDVLRRPLIAHVHVNWLAPVKIRRTLLGGSRRMVVFDDLEASEKVKVYDRGISLDPSPENVYQMLVGYRSGDMWAPQLAVTEALSVEAAHFVDVRRRTAPEPITDGEAGLRVVRLLEAATESMAEQGAAGRRCDEQPACRRMIPFVDLQAQYRSIKPEIDAAVLRRARQRAVHPRATRCGVRTRVRGLLRRRATRVARQQRHQRAAPGAAGRGRRPRRRGDHRPVHLRRDGGGDRLRRRAAGVRRHRPELLHMDPAAIEARDHAAHQGDHAGASLRPSGRHGSDPRRSRAGMV